MLKQIVIVLAACTLMACGEESLEVTEQAPVAVEAVDVIAQSTPVEEATSAEVVEVEAVPAPEAQDVPASAEEKAPIAEAVATGSVAE